MKNLIIASTSTIHGGKYLNYLKEELYTHFSNISELLFIPYARPGGISHDKYTAIANAFFNTIGIKVKGIHEFNTPKDAIKNAEGIFTGGGNTFVLVKQLYHFDILSELKQAILNGTPYLGSSAGSNICGLTAHTTNDMPIVLPKSLKTLGVVPFNINPHYLDPDPNSKHMGETRETRIKEFMNFNPQPVVGLREGSWIKVNGEDMVLGGQLNARVFKSIDGISEVPPGYNFRDLK
ncbi:MAG: dipeptidase PepE [Flavobacteriaceae bacterium]